jgi:pimeloyl-ACP methyl ester carboxylesterase
MMQKVLVNGLSVAYQRLGRGPALVLLHGFSIDCRSWRPQLEGLSNTFTVIAWDAPGAGQSEDPTDGFGIGDWADTLAGVLDAAGVQAAHVVGISWGGLLGQEFYRRHPSRLRSLVLVDTYAGWTGSLTAAIAEPRLEAALNDSTLAPADFVKKYLPGMFSDTAGDDVRQELGTIMADVHPTGFRLMATELARTDTRELLATINIPTLLIWGDADKRSPLRVGQAMRNAIPGARLEVIRGAGHLSNLERPDEFNEIVRTFCLSLSVG